MKYRQDSRMSVSNWSAVGLVMPHCSMAHILLSDVLHKSKFKKEPFSFAHLLQQPLLLQQQDAEQQDSSLVESAVADVQARMELIRTMKLALSKATNEAVKQSAAQPNRQHAKGHKGQSNQHLTGRRPVDGLASLVRAQQMRSACTALSQGIASAWGPAWQFELPQSGVQGSRAVKAGKRQTKKAAHATITLDPARCHSHSQDDVFCGSTSLDLTCAKADAAVDCVPACSHTAFQMLPQLPLGLQISAGPKDTAAATQPQMLLLEEDEEEEEEFEECLDEIPLPSYLQRMDAQDTCAQPPPHQHPPAGAGELALLSAQDQGMDAGQQEPLPSSDPADAPCAMPTPAAASMEQAPLQQVFPHMQAAWRPPTRQHQPQVQLSQGHAQYQQWKGDDDSMHDDYDSLHDDAHLVEVVDLDAVEDAHPTAPACGLKHHPAGHNPPAGNIHPKYGHRGLADPLDFLHVGGGSGALIQDCDDHDTAHRPASAPVVAEQEAKSTCATTCPPGAAAAPEAHAQVAAGRIPKLVKRQGHYKHLAVAQANPLPHMLQTGSRQCPDLQTHEVEQDEIEDEEAPRPSILQHHPCGQRHACFGTAAVGPVRMPLKPTFVRRVLAGPVSADALDPAAGGCDEVQDGGDGADGGSALTQVPNISQPGQVPAAARIIPKLRTRVRAGAQMSVGAAAAPAAADENEEEGIDEGSAMDAEPSQQLPAAVHRPPSVVPVLGRKHQPVPPVLPSDDDDNDAIQDDSMHDDDDDDDDAAHRPGVLPSLGRTAQKRCLDVASGSATGLVICPNLSSEQLVRMDLERILASLASQKPRFRPTHNPEMLLHALPAMAGMKQMSAQAYEQLQREGPGGQLASLISDASSLLKVLIGEDRHTALPQWPPAPALPPPLPMVPPPPPPHQVQAPGPDGALPAWAAGPQAVPHGFPAPAPPQQQTGRGASSSMIQDDADDDDDNFWDQIDDMVEQHLEKKAAGEGGVGVPSHTPHMGEHNAAAPAGTCPVALGQHSHVQCAGHGAPVRGAEAAVHITLDHDNEEGEDGDDLCCSIALDDDEDMLQKGTSAALCAAAADAAADAAAQVRTHEDYMHVQPQASKKQLSAQGLFEEVLGIRFTAELLDSPHVEPLVAQPHGSKVHRSVLARCDRGTAPPPELDAHIISDAEEMEFGEDSVPCMSAAAAAASLRRLFKMPAVAGAASMHASRVHLPPLPSKSVPKAKAAAAKERSTSPCQEATDRGAQSKDQPKDQLGTAPDHDEPDMVEQPADDAALDSAGKRTSGGRAPDPEVCSASVWAAEEASGDDECDAVRVELVGPDDLDDAYDEEQLLARAVGGPTTPPESPVGCDIEFGFLDDAMELDDGEVQHAAAAVITGLTVPQLAAALAAATGRGTQQARQQGHEGAHGGAVASLGAEGVAQAVRVRVGDEGGQEAAPKCAARIALRDQLRVRLIDEILRAHMRGKAALKALMAFVSNCLKEHSQAHVKAPIEHGGVIGSPSGAAIRPERAAKRLRHIEVCGTAPADSPGNAPHQTPPPVPFQTLAAAALAQRTQLFGDVDVTPHRLFLALLAVVHQTNNSRAPDTTGAMLVARPQWHWVPGCEVQLQQCGVGDVAVCLIPDGGYQPRS